MKIKYERISHKSQNQEGRRLLDKETYTHRWLDVVSGKVKFKERQFGKKVIELAEQGEVFELVVDDFSRLGRNLHDIVNTTKYFDEKGIKITCLNNGLSNIVNGKPNPIWSLMVGIFGSIYEMELENIKERTAAGMIRYREENGRWGRPEKSNETVMRFMSKPKSQEILKLLKKERTYKEIKVLTGCSENTISKVKKYSKLFDKQKKIGVSPNQLDLVIESEKGEKIGVELKTHSNQKDNLVEVEVVNNTGIQDNTDLFNQVLDTLEQQQKTLQENRKNLNDIEVMSWEEIYVERLKEVNKENNGGV